MKSSAPETVHLLELASLDGADRTCAVTPPWLPAPELAASVRAVGILAPLRVQARGDGSYRVVCGFRRRAAAQEAGLTHLPCLVEEAERPPLELFLQALQENLGFRRFSEVEQAAALAKLHFDFGIEEERLMAEFMPLLGVRADRRHLRQMLKISALAEDLQRSLTELGAELALKLSAWLPQERDLFLGLNSRYRLGRNRQREIFELLDELRAAERLRDPSADALHVWRDCGAAEADQTPAEAGPEKLQRILDALRTRRYPELSRWEAESRRLKAALRIPPEIQFTPPRHLEGDRILIQFAVRSPQDLRSLAAKLGEISERRELEELFGLL